MNINTIVTHENPDLDAILSVLLMKKFGSQLFPGVESAPVTFSSANTLPGNKTSKQLLNEGVMALDIGGGRFDTHPVGTNENIEKREKCAASIVAEELSLTDNLQWKSLIEYTRLQDTKGHSLYSKNYLHHLVSLNTILFGLKYIEPGSENMLRQGTELFEAIAACPAEKMDDPELIKKLISDYFEIPEHEELLQQSWMENLRKWLALFKENPVLAFSDIELDKVVSLKTIVNGAYISFGNDYEKTYAFFSVCLNALIRREQEWFIAVAEFKEKAKIIRVNNLNIVSIESENGLTIKVSRSEVRSDIFLYRNPANGATTVFVHRNGPLNMFRINRLAGLIRYIEARISGDKIVSENLQLTGTHCGWFLHQSGNLLIKGSDKALDFIPSKIPLDDLQAIICFFIDQKKNFSAPEKYLGYILEYENPAFKRAK